MDLQELIEDFSILEDWEDRYALIIDMGRQLPHMAQSDKNAQNKVEGCMSQVWMTSNVSEQNGSKIMQINADSDAFIVRGLIAVLLTVYSEKNIKDILKTDINAVFKDLQLEKHLSVNRRNGFYAMVQRIKAMAAAQLD